MTKNNCSPDLTKVIKWNDMVKSSHGDLKEFMQLHEEARGYLSSFKWCVDILDEYAGILYAGIVGVFLFRIVPAREDVDEWIWVVVGDLPPAYLTCDQCPNPASALDGYIGAMSEWVSAVENGESVAALIPVNVKSTLENADKIKTRLNFLDERILIDYKDDLRR